MKRRAFLKIATAAAALFSGASAMAQEAEPIKIGAILSLSGPAAPFGIPERNAAEVAAKFINDTGGINGRPIELIVADDQTNPTEAARAAQHLITSDKVVAIVGASTGSGTLAMAPVAARNEVPVLAPNGTIGVTEAGTSFYPWTFRTSVSDTVTIPALLDRAVEDGAQRIAVFYQEDALGRYAMELLEGIDAESDSFEIVAKAAAAMDATDLTAQVTRIVSANPDAVVLPISSVGVGGSFLRTSTELGLDVPVYGGLAMAQNAILELAGESATKNLIVANMINPSNPTEAQRALYDMIRDAGNEPAGGFTDLFGANSVVVVAEAMRIATEITGPAIRDALESGVELNAWAITPYSYGEDNHDGLGPDAIVWARAAGGVFAAAD